MWKNYDEQEIQFFKNFTVFTNLNLFHFRTNISQFSERSKT